MRKTPCVSVKNSLRKPGVTASECNCCGFWEKRGAFAVNAVTSKTVKIGK